MSFVKRGKHAVYDLKYHFVWIPKYRKLVLKGPVVESREKTGKVEYFCREDAEAAAGKLRSEKSLYHSCECNVTEKVTYARGRPPKNGERTVSKDRYILEGRVVERSDEVEQARKVVGCFVLLTNTPTERDGPFTRRYTRSLQGAARDRAQLRVPEGPAVRQRYVREETGSY